MKTLDESDVGIFCYTSNLPGFRGFPKQRYSDFIVNEVDTDGNLVHLTSLEAPLETREESRIATNDAATKNYASEIESFRGLAGDSDAESLEALINQINSGGGEEVSPIVLSPNSDKSHRTEIHNFFKKNFKFLVTDALMDQMLRQNASAFHLYKENKDSLEALGVIGKVLGIQPRSFGFTGTKDKRSVSIQRITVFKQRACRLAALNDRLIGIKVGDFCYVKEELVLGQLSGNRFTVTLRGVVADSEETIKASASALGRLGFINYCGLQRFGSGSVPTYLIGAMLFRGLWKAAVNMILDLREGERDAVSKAREYYKETNNIDGTLRQLPRHLVAEGAILQRLKKCPRNYLQALKIPRTLRIMYVHGYQSYLWNHAASTRVQKYGPDQVVVGDLVYCKEYNNKKVKGITGADCKDEDSNDVFDSHDLDDSGTDLPEEKNNPAKAVTTEAILAGKFAIDNVVLPLPGRRNMSPVPSGLCSYNQCFPIRTLVLICFGSSRVILPTNDTAQVYHGLAKKDAINLTESAHNVKEFSITSMRGSYRRVFQKPVDYEWELLTYTHGTIPLGETDLDLIAKSKPTHVEENRVNGIEERHVPNHSAKRSKHVERDEELQTNDNEVDSERETELQAESACGTNSQEPHMALKLSFTFPASCYATMAIRELLKTSTSARSCQHAC